MRSISFKYITLFSVVAGMLFFGVANAQYSADFKLQQHTISKNFSDVELQNFSVFHKGSPDTLINQTKNTDVIVEIRDLSGTKYPGLKNKNGDAISLLKAQTISRLNEDRLRRGVGAGKKVELIITIPGVRNDSTGYYDIKQIAWTLGAGHNPTYTKLNYLGRKEGYQIIFVYENGIAPRDQDVPEQHKIIHIQGHICEPGDPACSPEN